MPGDIGKSGDQGPPGVIGIIGYAGAPGDKGTKGEMVGAQYFLMYLNPFKQLWNFAREGWSPTICRQFF